MRDWRYAPLPGDNGEIIDHFLGRTEVESMSVAALYSISPK